MRNIILSILLLVLPIIASAREIPMDGCSVDTEESVDETAAKTILVFMPWSGSSSSEGLLPYMQDNLDSIYSAIKSRGGLEDTRLMLFLSETRNKSKLSEVVYDEAKSTCKTKLVKQYSGQDYTTQEGLTAVLNEVKNYAPAQNYAMMVGCHGTGWTFKESWRRYPYYAKSTGWPGVVTETAGERIPYEGYYGELTDMHTRFIGSVSEINTYSIEIPTIAQAIADAGMKMQFIMFDDCYMANVEVAYELRNAANYLLASTSEVMAIGVPYKTMWPMLATGIPAYERAVSAFYTFYMNYPMPYGAFAAIDCSKMDELASAMRDINARYTLKDEDRSEIQVLDGFDEAIFYDMGDYLKKLCTDSRDYEQVKAVVESVVRSKCHTEYVYSFLYTYPRYIKVNAFSGITISDPSINTVALDGKERTSWWKATHNGSSGIESAGREEPSEQVFTPEGKRLKKPQKGLNIIRKSNGMTRKVMSEGLGG